MGDPQPRGSSDGFARQALHIFVLTALALIARLYAIVGRESLFFALRQSLAVDLILLVLLLSVVLPGTLVLIEWLAGRRWRRRVHAMLVAMLCVLICLPLCQRLPGLSGKLVVAIAVVAGMAATAAYTRFRAAGLLVTVLAPILVISPAIFLFGSPASTCLRHWSRPAPLVVAVERPAPVVMIVFDEFCCLSLLDRRGQIDAARYPNFAALAAAATWYRNATAVAVDTETAMPAIVTGNRPPADEREPDVYQFPRSLFTLMAGSHQMHVYERFTGLCPDEFCGRRNTRLGLAKRMLSIALDLAIIEAHVLLPRDLAGRLPPVAGRVGFFIWPNTAKEMDVDPMVERGKAVEDFIAGIHRTARPGFHFMHAMLPHSPWTYLPTGQERPDVNEGLVEWNQWGNDEAIVARVQERYLLQLQYVDNLLGKLLARLRATGLYDDAMVVITADHGVAFVPGDQRRLPNEHTYAQVISIPLFIKLPRQEHGAIDDRNVESIDIVPTIAAVLGLKLPWPTDGQSVLDGPARQTKIVRLTDAPQPTWSCDGRFEGKWAAIEEILARRDKAAKSAIAK